MRALLARSVADPLPLSCRSLADRVRTVGGVLGIEWDLPSGISDVSGTSDIDVEPMRWEPSAPGFPTLVG